MKNGFISIPIVIAIVIGTAVVGGVGYVGVQQYQKSEERKAIAQLELEEQTEIQKLREELELLRQQQEEQGGQKVDQQPQVVERIVERPVIVEKPVVVETPTPQLLPIGPKEEVKDKTESAPAEVLEVLFVDATPLQNFLRINWETNKPSESKIFIWPIHEVPGYLFFESPSNSSNHYINITYNNLPIYSPSSQVLNNYTEYRYKVEAKSGDLFIDKTGTFVLHSNINMNFILNLLELNPGSTCDTLTVLQEYQRVACKNFVSYHGL